MNLRKRSIIQIIFTLAIIIACFMYNFYINDLLDYKLLSVADMNPYGGWSALKSMFTDLSYRWRGVSKSIALTTAITVTALLFGRFFCGYICPIGSLQDFFKFIGNKFNLKEIQLKKTKYFNPELLKYFILIITMALSVFGIGNLMATYSPWLAYVNIFVGFGIHKGTLILIVIIILSLFIKRVFCRCFCPLGAFQALLYAIGPSKVSKNNSCDGCSACLINCPVNIQYSDDLFISPECINCSECISSKCVKGGQGFKYTFAGITVNKFIIIYLVLFMSIYILFSLSSSKEALSEGVISNLNDGVYTGTGLGFGGYMDVEIEINNNKITKVSILNHRETTGYFEEVFKEMSKELKHSNNLNVDVISGATVTSRGFLNAVKDAVSKSILLIGR